MFLGLPAPLFTMDLETPLGAASVDVRSSPLRQSRTAFGLQVTLGQVNTVVLCPPLTSHSELSDEALRQSGISPTTIRISVGEEDRARCLRTSCARPSWRSSPIAPDSWRTSRRRKRSIACTRRRT